MFKMGGPTSGGTGITSGLETPKRGLVDGPGGYAGFDLDALLKKRTAAYNKLGTGLQNQMGSIGPMALYSAVSGGALENVDSLGDLAQAFGNPAVLQSVMGGLGSQNKLQTKIDTLDLSKVDSDIKTGLAIQKAKKGKEYEFKQRLALADSKRELQNNILAKATTEEEKKVLRSSPSYRKLEDDIAYLLRGMNLSEYLTSRSIKEGEDFDREQAESDFYEIRYGSADGGRINKQMGGGFDMGQEQVMPATQTMAPGTEVPDEVIKNITGMIPTETPQVPNEVIKNITGIQPQGEDPFQILRARLPREIPDDVVSLIAYNQKAFADFANIQDQDDVDLFNQRYNVQLVVDLASR